MEKLKVQFKRTTKRSLQEFNIEEARGWTIDRLQQIEYRINKIIVDYFKPENSKKFQKIMLNGAILDIGGKLKVLANIEGFNNKIIDKIRTLATIRNGFAHAPISDMITVNIDDSEGGSEKFSAVAESMIEVMNAQGIIKRKNAYDYLVQFWELNKEIREHI